ncbi:MAG: DUF1848 domain-containing protein [Clostridiales bacterium]|nr:DUF1848 domain-containing protein [Clostridiales bacterium]
MIISISRRTDLPAFYSRWLMNRLREGYALVPQPRQPHRLSRVSLDREHAEFLVFWTKNPAPLLSGPLREIRRMGYPFYFHFTLTPYGREWEPGLPDKRRLLDDFRELSRQAGPERVIWRYDPVLLDDGWTIDAHRAAFDQMAAALEGYTRRCIFSFVDRYAGPRFRGLRPITAEEQTALARAFAGAAARHGIRLFACCESEELTCQGIKRAACIDGELIAHLENRPVRGRRDSGQRPGCLCAESADIGCYGCCPHGCLYCYANRSSLSSVERRAALHDPDSPLLIGRPGKEDQIVECRKPAVFTSQLSLFN